MYRIVTSTSEDDLVLFVWLNIGLRIVEISGRSFSLYLTRKSICLSFQNENLNDIDRIAECVQKLEVQEREVLSELLAELVAVCTTPVFMIIAKLFPNIINSQSQSWSWILYSSLITVAFAIAADIASLVAAAYILPVIIERHFLGPNVERHTRWKVVLCLMHIVV